MTKQELIKELEETKAQLKECRSIIKGFQEEYSKIIYLYVKGNKDVKERT